MLRGCGEDAPEAPDAQGVGMR